MKQKKMADEMLKKKKTSLFLKQPFNGAGKK